MSLAERIVNAPFAIVDEKEAALLAGTVLSLALAGNRHLADALLARLEQDAGVHDLAGNCIKRDVIRKLADDVCDAVAVS